MKFYIDDREDKERILLLRNDPFFANIKVTRLDVGDILVKHPNKEDIIIEVKTFQDWGSSVFNNRIRSEANGMKDNKVRAIVVYDDGKYNARWHSLPSIGHNYAMQSELQFRWHIPVFFCDDFNRFKSCIKAIITQVHQEFKPLPYPIVKQSSDDVVKGILLGIPRVGDITVDKLVDNFGTPGRVFNATDEDLEDAGIPPKARENIGKLR